jgi:FkbM family methyltransferase
VQIEVADQAGQLVEFECPDQWESRWTCTAILEGRTYPLLPFVPDVQVIWDAGANCGAASVHLARSYPAAQVHAFEPGTQALSFLRRNTAGLGNVSVHPIGLNDRDQVARLNFNPSDIGQSSVHNSEPGAEGEDVTLRSAGAWAAENGVDRIDVIKLDVEGCEVAVLHSLLPLIPTVKVLYVEYESRQDRRTIDALLAPTHELYFSMMMALDQGECVYLHRDLADHPDAVPRLKEIVFGEQVS